MLLGGEAACSFHIERSTFSVGALSNPVTEVQGPSDEYLSIADDEKLPLVGWVLSLSVRKHVYIRCPSARGNAPKTGLLHTQRSLLGSCGLHPLCGLAD